MTRTAAVAVVVMMALIACSDQRELRIGVVMGGGGTLSAHLAAEDVNAEGGIRGRPLEIQVAAVERGAHADPETAIAIAQELTADPSILAVVGHWNSSASLAAARIYNSVGLLQLAPTTTAPAYAAIGRFSFRMVADDSVNAAMLSDVVKGETDAIGLVYVNDAYGRGLLRALRANLPDEVRPRVELGYLEGGDVSWLERIGREVADSAVTTLFWLGRASELAPVLESIEKEGGAVRVLGGDGLDSEVVYRDPERYEGVEFLQLADLSRPDKELEGLRRRLEARGVHMSSETVLTYDAVRLLAEVLRGGARTRSEVRDALAGVGLTRPTFEGLAGVTAFTHAGDARRLPHLVRVERTGVRRIPSPEGRERR